MQAARLPPCAQFYLALHCLRGLINSMIVNAYVHNSNAVWLMLISNSSTHPG